MARERYLVNVEEQEIRHEEQRELTPKEKRKNFWYYNKWKFAAGAFIIVLVAYFISSVVLRTRPDYEVALITQYGFSDPSIEQLEEALNALAEDRNGDGKVVVQVNQYRWGGDSTSETGMIDTAKIITDLDACQSMIFLCDTVSLDNLVISVGSSFFVDFDTGEPAPDNLNDLSPIRVPYQQWKAFENFRLEDRYHGTDPEEYTEAFMGRLRLSIRTIVDTRHEDSKKKIEYYEAAKRLTDRIISGE